MLGPVKDEQVPLITLPNWVKAAAACGFSLEPLIRELGIDVDLVHVESATIARTDFERLMAACVARSRRRHFPFVLGDTFAFEYLPEIETFLTTSPTLRESARVFEWLPVLVNPLLTIRVVETPGFAGIRLDRVSGDPPRALQWFVEGVFATIAKFGRALMRGQGDFRRVTFQHARPDYADQYDAVFRVPVLFGQSHNALEFDPQLLDRPLEGAFHVLHQQAELRVARRLSERPPPEDVATRLEHVLERKPSLLAQGLPQAAAELGLHPRTLQRRLREANLRFGEVQARMRRRLAETWLADPAITIETISERLGFADRRSFTRAFSAWTGSTPSEVRRKS
ncbi:MAG TPA: AraC family transcriptional regulator ligand-binding domain-containing protein [Nevskiaceae bacterium]|nr:AraC family transcriptional regulator ligand-binding domain-containing protein [Nevskiaceae bacterium]